MGERSTKRFCRFWISRCTLGWVVAVASVAGAAPTANYDEGQQEAAQARELIQGLGAHLSYSNEDTRFAVAPASTGLLSPLASVGTVQTASSEVGVDRVGSGIILTRCFALTAYHVTEGREVMSTELIPLPGRKSRYSYRSKRDGRVLIAPAVVTDPGVLQLRDRKWADDFVLLRFETPQADEDIYIPKLGHIVGQNLKTSRDFEVDEQIFFAAGYPVSDAGRGLQADICTPKAVARNFGVLTNCVATPGMSGGPFLWLKWTGTSYEKVVIGLLTQPANDQGVFAKSSASRSAFAAFTPAVLAALASTMARFDPTTCKPT